MEETGGKLIVGITGATGSIFGVRLLQMLQGTGIETHLVMSQWAARTLLHETSYTVEEVRQMATCFHHSGDLGAAISSGSFVTKGMIIAPCSVRTLAAIAGGKLVLGLLTVLVFSLGFASVLVVVGVVAARVGQLILIWLSNRWVGWVQIGAALLIVVVGIILTANAWRTVAALG